MQGLHEMLKQLGGGLLAIGILMAGITGWTPGTEALARLLLDPTLVWQFGGVLAIAGGLFMLVGDVIGRRALRRTAAGREAEHIAAQTRTERVVIRSTGATGEMLSLDERPDINREAIPMLGTQKRVCLKPVWPQRETSHWVGGLPNLPTDTPWPEINNKPASFIAQIAMADMPDSLWQGIGPRSGWLVFFGDGESDCAVKVLHVEGKTEPREQPAGVAYCWDLSTSIDGMKHMIGTAAEVPPKWFVEIADQTTLGSVEDMASEGNSADGEYEYWDNEKGDWIWAERRPLARRDVSFRISDPRIRNGTTWDTPFAILAALRVTLEDHMRQIENSNRNYQTWVPRVEKEIAELTLLAQGSGEEAFKAQKDIVGKKKMLEQRQEAHLKKQLALKTMVPRLEQIVDLEAQLRDTSKTVAYDPVIGSDLHAFVEDIEAELKSESSMNHLGFRENFAKLMEHHARLAYANDPSSLPPELYELYTPLWQQECEDTAIFLGTNVDMEVGKSWWVRLLDMPPNPLTGITIGDASRFYADLPAEDLNAGDFSTAYGSNTHGTY